MGESYLIRPEPGHARLTRAVVGVDHEGGAPSCAWSRSVR
jgi:hypothetical protein